MFDPDENRAACEKYLSHSLGGAVKLVHASQLTQSTRQAPWKLDVTLDGSARSYVMQLDARGMEYEYRVPQGDGEGWCSIPSCLWLGLARRSIGLSPVFSATSSRAKSLLGPMLAGEPWAETLYFDTGLCPAFGD